MTEDKKNTLELSRSMNDPNSPYYLTSADHPGNVISPVILNGENYSNWVRIVINVLKSKQKYCLVDGSLSKPTSDSLEVHVWEKNNSMVIAWLYNVIDKSLHESVAYVEKASEIWKDLKERYSQNNEIRIHQLWQEITLIKQGNLTLSEYFTKLKGSWDELGACLQLPTCNCAKEYNSASIKRQKKSINS